MRKSGGTSSSDALSDAPLTREQLLARVRDVSDILDLARDTHLGFTEVLRDADAGIVLSTMPVADFPVNMMKARAAMPCPASEFLKYLELDIRTQWDDLFSHGHVVQHVDENTYLKYMSFNSPIPFLSPRDFELVVHETFDEVRQSWVLKALSAPPGMLVPLGRSANTVRGTVVLSGFVVRALAEGMEPPLLRGARVCCEVTYVALVHPRGWLPPALINLVIGKQTSALRNLQSFVSKNPLTDAAAKTVNRAARSKL